MYNSAFPNHGSAKKLRDPTRNRRKNSYSGKRRIIPHIPGNIAKISVISLAIPYYSTCATNCIFVLVLVVIGRGSSGFENYFWCSSKEQKSVENWSNSKDHEPQKIKIRLTSKNNFSLLRHNKGLYPCIKQPDSESHPKQH